MNPSLSRPRATLGTDHEGDVGLATEDHSIVPMVARTLEGWTSSRLSVDGLEGSFTNDGGAPCFSLNAGAIKE